MVYLLYQFNDGLYHKAKCFGFTDNKMYEKQMRMTMSDSQSERGKKRVLQLSQM